MSDGASLDLEFQADDTLSGFRLQRQEVDGRAVRYTIERVPANAND